MTPCINNETPFLQHDLFQTAILLFQNKLNFLNSSAAVVVHVVAQSKHKRVDEINSSVIV